MDNFTTMKHTLIALLFTLICSHNSFAQLNLPNASPDAELKQQVGFAEIEVKYSRPGAKGRKVFGELVPYGEIWRTGAHDATTIRFSDSVKLEGNPIPPGTYSLFTIPTENQWTIILNKVAEMHGTSDYTQDQDLVRFNVKSEKSSRLYESFTIEINDLIKNSAVLFIAWENIQVKVAIETEVDGRVMREINERINVKKEDRPGLFYQASLYYFNNGKDLKTAYEWVKTANTKTQDAMYLQLQAKIEAALAEYSAALRSLNSSTELAKTKKLDQVLSANEKLKQEWASKQKTK
jgi:hypothetical protein